MAHVAADSSSSSVADQLSVRLGQEYRVKLGRSFTFPEQNSFHTIKYDFKPQSVDSTKPGHLKVTDDEVNVSLPVVSQGDLIEDFTHFRGNKKPCTKECILIINTRTGEAILEKISNNVNLKAVRDGRKPAPVNRDRSVSPAPPFMTQSKGHSAAKSQLSTGGHRHLTPSPIPMATPPTSNSSTPSATKGGGVSSGSSNTTSGKKGQKRQMTKSKTPKTPAIVATSAKQESSKGGNGRKPKAKKKSESSAKQPSIPAAPKIKTEPAAMPQLTTTSSSQSAMASMPLLGMDLTTTQEISPIQSSNPTPEPILPPSRKKPKLASSGNSSSSSSDSSDSDSEGEEPMLQAPPTHQAPPPQFSSVPVTRVTTVTQPLSSSSMPVFSSHPIAQKGHIAQKSHPGQLSQQYGSSMQPKIPPPPKQSLSSGSSSDSDSDSSSGSSSSDSSSDSSDEENDKEVAALSGGPVAQGQRSFRRSYSELKTDLQLSSDSGSSSD